MTHMETGRYAAKRQTWREVNPRHLLHRIIENDLEGDEESWRKAFLEAVAQELGKIDLSGTYAEACALFCFEHSLRAHMRDEPKTQNVRKAAQEATTHAVATERARMKSIILLQLPTPNGKTLGECTSRDCTLLGGWYAKLAKLVPARKTVADVLSEERVRKLWQSSR